MSQRQLTKSVTNRRVSGVIAGIAEYFGLGRDVVTILRILFVVLAFGSWGGLIPLYFVASWIIPSARPRNYYDDSEDDYQESQRCRKSGYHGDPDVGFHDETSASDPRGGDRRCQRNL